MPNLESFKCSNCGNNIHIENGFGPTIECGCCHQPLMNPFYDNSDVIKCEIVSCELDINNHKKELIEHIINNVDVPYESISGFAIHNIRNYYLPLFVFECSYESFWTASFAYREEVRGYNSTFYRTVGPARQGVVNGNTYSLVIANLLQDFPEQVKDLLVQLIRDIDLASFPTFEPLHMHNDITQDKFLSVDRNINQAYNDDGIAYIKEKAYKEAKKQMGVLTGALLISEEQISCKVDASSKSLIYIPIQIVEYETNNDVYYSIYTCNNNKESFWYTHPVGGQIEADVYVKEQNKRKSKSTQNVENFGCMCIFAAVVIAAVTTYELSKSLGWTIGISTVVLIIAMCINGNILSNKDKQIVIDNQIIDNEINNYFNNSLKEKRNRLSGL